VLGGEGRVGGAQEKLPVEALLGGDGGAVDPKQPRLRLAEEAAVAGLGLEPAGEIVPPGRGQGVGAGERLLELDEDLLADALAALGLLRVVAADEAVAHRAVV